MVFLSRGLKDIVIEMIHSTKCTNCEALKLLPFFVLLKTVNKEQAVQLILFESASICQTLRISVVIWAGISHAMKHRVDLNQCPHRAMCSQGKSLPHIRNTCRRHNAQCRTLGEELTLQQVLCCIRAVPAVICCSFILVRTDLSTDYSHSYTGIGGSELLWISLHGITNTLEKSSPCQALKNGGNDSLKLLVNPLIQFCLVLVTLVFLCAFC